MALHRRRLLPAALAAFVSVSMVSCGGEGGSGTLSLSITDAPVDEADEVWIQFTGLEIKPAGGTAISLVYCEDPATMETVVQEPPCDVPAVQRIDLKALSNGASTLLLDAYALPAGAYNWIRLLVEAEPNVRDSFIVIGGNEYELRIPSGAQTGLKLNRGFVVPDGGSADFTIDFDLRKSVHQPQSGTDYVLRPTLRIVDNHDTGSIAGTVDAALLVSGCTPAVYVYSGTVATPDDVDGVDPDPITSAEVKLDSGSGEYRYKAAFLEAGDYTVAFTCDAADDQPDTDDALAFSGTAPVTVSAGQTTAHDF